jgi:segregation and condensation protein A
MDAAKLFEGIALLIELAERGEIDPWDVQVIDVIDRYLSKLISTQEATQADREADLSQSGQAFLSASMLVLFKANTLVELESSDDLDQSEDLLPVEDGVRERRLPLEQQLCRRPTALPPQKRRVTLQELIEQLQLMATQLQVQSEGIVSTKTTRRNHLRSQSRTQALRALELAHQENLTEVAGELEQVLNIYSHNSFTQHKDWLDLDQLVQFWVQTTKNAYTSESGGNKLLSPGSISSQHDPNLGAVLPDESISPLTIPETEESISAQLTSPLSPQQHDRVSVFWALLLLSAQSKVELSQEEFYQEIKIRSLP